MITIIRAVQTCYVCPSQWDAQADDGRILYLRYRFGVGTASIDGVRVADFEYGDPMDGVIDLHTFCELAGLYLDPDAVLA